MDRKKFDQLLGRLDTESERAARRAVGEFQKAGTDVLSRLCDSVVHDRRVRVRRWCAEALGGFASAESERALKRALRDPNMSVRYHAVRAADRYELERLGGVIVKLVDDPSPGVRHVAVRALGRLRPRGTVAALSRALQDGKWHVRQAAAEASAMVKSPRLAAHLRAAMDDERPAVRRAASRALRPLIDQ